MSENNVMDSNSYRIALNWNSAQSVLGRQPRVDLIAAAKEQLRFLARVYNTPALRKPEVLDCAVARYFNNWLPLAFKFQCNGFPDYVHAINGSYLVPPLDCAWIWHCHKLSPVRYVHDCERLFGKLIDIQSLPSDGSTQKPSEQASLNWWWREYPEEPYHLVQVLEGGTSVEFQRLVQRKFQKRERLLQRKVHYLVAAAHRQAPFYYQVRSSWFADDGFLEVAVQRYKGYLYMMQEALRKRKNKDPPVLLVPTYDIDLIWHSHQLHPSAYGSDTTALIGRVLDHEDTDSDRRGGTKLHYTFLETCDRWWDTFGTVYERAGSMYKGAEPPAVPPPPAKIDEDKLLRFRLMLKRARISSSLPSHKNPGVEETLESNFRATLQVHLVIVGARITNLPKSHCEDSFIVHVTALKRCPVLNLSTLPRRPSQNNDVVWNHGIALEAEKATLGLQLELVRTRNLKKSVGRYLSSSSPGNSDCSDESLGKVSIHWSDPHLFSSNTDFSSTKSEVLSTPLGRVELQYSISVTPAQLAPKICRVLHSRATDEKGQKTATKDFKRLALESQTGKWTTTWSRTVVDHNGSHLLSIRIFSRPISHGPGDHPIPMADPTWEETMNPKGEFTQIEFRSLGVALPIVVVWDQYRLKKVQVRVWSLFDDTVFLTVRKPSKRNEVVCALYGECGPNPMRLLPGTRLEFMKDGETLKDKCLTLIRYTPDAPKGQATGLINLSKAYIEVMPGESTRLMATIFSVVSQSLHAFGHPIVEKQVESMDKTGSLLGFCDGNLGAITLQSNHFSEKWTPLDSSKSLLKNILCGVVDLY